MRAEEGDARFVIKVSSVDSQDGVRVQAPNVNLDAESMNEGAPLRVLFGFGPSDAANTYETSILTNTLNLKNAKHNSYRVESIEVKQGVVTYAYIENLADLDTTSLLDLGIKKGETYEVVISLFCDDNGSGLDDRTEAAIKVLLPTSYDNSNYSAVNANDIVYVEKGTNVVEAIEDGDVKALPGWYDVDVYDGATDAYYTLVYGVDLSKVNGDMTIYAEWVKQSEQGEIPDRFAKSTTNDKDTNGDGKVSCDEYYGTTGLEWSDKLNACVVSSTGDAVVTIPNTATK